MNGPPSAPGRPRRRRCAQKGGGWAPRRSAAGSRSRRPIQTSHEGLGCCSQTATKRRQRCGEPRLESMLLLLGPVCDGLSTVAAGSRSRGPRPEATRPKRATPRPEPYARAVTRPAGACGRGIASTRRHGRQPLTARWRPRGRQSEPPTARPSRPQGRRPGGRPRGSHGNRHGSLAEGTAVASTAWPSRPIGSGPSPRPPTRRIPLRFRQ